jgi:hypothetical protein
MEICRFCLIFLIKTLVFRRISLLGSLPKEENSVLYLGFHRNGAVDGWVYSIALARQMKLQMKFMVASNLVKNPIAKLFFSGIEVTRRGDEGSAVSNRKGLGLAVSQLVQGGSLFIFPEGTSTLGPCHLEFMKGAALIASRVFKLRRDLVIIPLSIRYFSPQLWGGDVEVEAGNALSLEKISENGALPDSLQVHNAVTLAMESLAPDFVSEERLEDAAALAAMIVSMRVSTPLEGPPYSRALYLAAKMLESDLGTLWQIYKRESAPCKKWRGFAPFPEGGVWKESAVFLLTGVLVFSAVVMNIPAVLAGACAGRRFPDGPNVVLLWKSLAGITVFLIQSPILWAMLLWAGWNWGIFLHIGFTVLGCKAAESFRRSYASLWNLCFHRHLRQKFVRLKEALHDETLARFFGS